MDQSSGRSASPVLTAADTGLAMDEGGAGPKEQRAQLQSRLEQAESVFRFMGKGHPRYASTYEEIQRLKVMLASLRDGR